MNSKIRQTAYLLGTIATGIITLLSVWKGISGETATAMSNMVTALLGLLGVGATATATAVVTKQRKDGVFDDKPQMTPAEQAITGIQATVAQAENAADQMKKLQEAVTGALGSVPVVGPLTQQVIDSLKLNK